MIYRVAQRAQFFATRHSGQQIRAAIEAQFAGLPDGERLTLDFGGVEAVTIAFADELVAALVDVHGDRIVVTGADPEVAEVIRRAVARRSEPARMRQALDGMAATEVSGG